MFKKLNVFAVAFLLLLLISPAASAISDGADNSLEDLEPANTDIVADDPEGPGSDNEAILADRVYYQKTGTWTYTLIHEYTIRNNSRSMAFNVQVTTPLIDGKMPEYASIRGEVLSPAAVSITEDEEGHRNAVYTFDYLYGNQSIKLTQRFVINVSAMSYQFDRTNIPDQYSAEELPALSNYLYPGEGINSTDPQIIAFTQKAVGSLSDPYQKARAIFSAVNLYLTYINDPEADQDGAAVLARGTANCQGYANLYISCLRAAGIAAKRQNGYLYLPQVHTTAEYVDQINGRINLENLRHAWVEFYLPDTGWITADPTFTYTYENNGIVQKFVKWTYFANIDNSCRYIFFREGSLSDELINYSYTAATNDVTVGFGAYLMPGEHWEAFNDIDGHWAQSAITYCVSNSLFNGISTNKFAPEQSMTRAMFVTVIGRLYEKLGGEITHSGIVSFSDTDSSAYYFPYLEWAVENGLISGYGNGLFGPNDEITREQMAKIISLFAEIMGSNITIYEGSLPNYSDGNSISQWAKTGVSWCSDKGIITGMPGNVFSPRTYATRAQVAAIIQRTAIYFGN